MNVQLRPRPANSRRCQSAYRDRPVVTGQQRVQPLLRTALPFYSLALWGDSLTAYTLAGVPIPWMLQAATILFVGVLISRNRWVPAPGIGFLLSLCAWGAIVTLANIVTGDYANMMPLRATTTYKVFLSLRILILTSFAAQVYLVHWLLKHGAAKEVLRRTANAGVIAAVCALYIYVAQLTGLPEPPRTRIGTAGFEQSTTFSYAFHRAMGTFLEPGEFGGWLVVPLFCSMIAPGRFRTGKTMLIAVALMLSGSLAALGAAVLSFFLALAIVRPTHSSGFYQLLLVPVMIAGSYGLFSLLVTDNEGGSTNLITVLQERIEPILEDGTAGTNRSYIYEYLEQTTIPWFGHGYGHPQLLMARDMNLPTVGSFLNLYITTLYSVGWIGLGLLLGFLGVPIVRMVQRRTGDQIALTIVSAAYFSWLLRFFMCIDEPTLSVAISYSLLAFNVSPVVKVPQPLGRRRLFARV